MTAFSFLLLARAMTESNSSNISSNPVIIRNNYESRVVYDVHNRKYNVPLPNLQNSYYYGIIYLSMGFYS